MRLLKKSLLHALIIVPYLLLFTETGFYGAFVTSLSITIVSYVVNEQLMLKATNAFLSALTAGFTALVVLWLYTDFAEWDVGILNLILLSALFAFLEWVSFKQKEEARA